MFQLEYTLSSHQEDKSQQDQDKIDLNHVTKQKDAIVDFAQSLNDKQKSFEAKVREKFIYNRAALTLTPIRSLQNNNLQVEVSVLTEHKDTLENELKSALEANKYFQGELSDNLKKASHLEEKNAVLIGEISQKTSLVQKYEMELEKNNQQLKELKQLQDELLSSITKAQDKENKWKDKADETRNLLQQTNEALENAHGKYISLLESKATVDEDYLKLKEEYQVAKFEIERLNCQQVRN